MSTSAKTISHSDLQDLFLDELRDVLWAERQLTRALPKMAKAAHSEKLRQAFTRHLAETVDHVDRLDTVFESLGLTARAAKCEAMEGLLQEADDLMEDYVGSPALDAALIIAAQKVEHYEIATYGTLRAFAGRLGHAEAETLLAQTLEEECAADQGLTRIAEAEANAAAASAA